MEEEKTEKGCARSAKKERKAFSTSVKKVHTRYLYLAKKRCSIIAIKKEKKKKKGKNLEEGGGRKGEKATEETGVSHHTHIFFRSIGNVGL